MSALIALLNTSAEGGGTAVANISQGLTLLARQD
jgi:hypothetical protein